MKYFLSCLLVSAALFASEEEQAENFSLDEYCELYDDMEETKIEVFIIVNYMFLPYMIDDILLLPVQSRMVKYDE